MPNQTVSTLFYETYGKQHDVEACGPLFTTDAMIHSSTMPVPMDFNAYKQVGYAFLAAFADLDVEVLEQFEAGDRIISRLAWSGTHTGELNGIPPTGRRFNSEAIVIDRVVNGQIQERRDVSDMLSMMQQLGVIPS